ncbi:hypothetical protein GCM10022217_12210 [Chryseobacterium ginsenosidimutans]|uniref:hypothetical protein n=1 Tax=Chryseobacterium ginsenosidimutans TaxID=687846 RepID=UPI0031D6A30B
MELTVFQELTEQIAIECFYMTDSQQEEKVIQLIDLHHFIDCYNSKIKIINYINHPINIIEENSTKKGVLFYDLKHPISLDLNFFESFKRNNHLKEIWFVFVEENSISNSKQYFEFIIENSIEIFYDKIFRFNFFQSTIKELK